PVSESESLKLWRHVYVWLRFSARLVRSPGPWSGWRTDPDLGARALQVCASGRAGLSPVSILDQPRRSVYRLLSVEPRLVCAGRLEGLAAALALFGSEAGASNPSSGQVEHRAEAQHRLGSRQGEEEHDQGWRGNLLRRSGQRDHRRHNAVGRDASGAVCHSVSRVLPYDTGRP